MDYAHYLRIEEARMIRESQFYYERYLDLFAGHGPLLDIGCGTGNFLALAAGRITAKGLDFDAESVQRCRERGFSATVGSIVELPFATGSLGGVFAAHILEHLWRDELLAAAAEIGRVLRPGGKAIIVVPHPKDIWDFYTDPTHVSPMTEKRLSMLFNQFAKVVFVNYYIPILKHLLTVRLHQPGLYRHLLRLLPFRGRTSITAVCTR